MSKVLGIDLGTTNCCMAVLNEYGRPKVITNSEGHNTTPSVVLFRGEERVVGVRAKRARVAQANNVAMLMKRYILKEHWRFIGPDGKEYSPEELSAIVLRKLKQDAEKALGEEIKQAVITVPAYFGDLERNRTKAAGEMAGLDVLRIINEPTAAALAYGLDQAESEQTILVYDLGGGTFDVTIMKVTGSKIQVITSGGNKSLGGADFDQAIVEHMKEQFIATHQVDPTKGGESLGVLQDFLDKAEQAKFDLSADTETDINLSAEGQVLDLNLNRQTFESLIANYIEETKGYMDQALSDASMTWGDIDRVLLVGGSVRIPAVKKMVEEASGKTAEGGVNPDEIVAEGAAIVGASEVGQTIRKETGEEVSGLEVRDVTAHSFGVKAKEGGAHVNSIILPKDTSIPASRTRNFTTPEDNQTSVEIIVLEGEELDPDLCEQLGALHIEGLPPKPKGVPKIEVTMTYTREAIIQVTARELTTGLEIKGEVKGSGRTTAADIAAVQGDIEKLKIK